MAIDRGNKITIITDEPMIDTKGNPSLIIVGVYKDVEMDGEIINLAKSVYPLDNLRNVIFDSKKNLVITDKNRADKILAGVGIPSPERTNIVDSAKGSISQNESLSQEQKSGKEAENLYEQIYRGNDRLFYGNFKGIKSAKGKDIWNSIVLENRGYDDGNGGKIGTERPGNNAGGSGANLPGSNSKVSLNLSTRLSEPTAADYAFLNEKRSRPGVQQRYAATMRQYRALQAQISNAKKELGTAGQHILSEKALDMFAKKVKKDSQTTMTMDELKERLI